MTKKKTEDDTDDNQFQKAYNAKSIFNSVLSGYVAGSCGVFVGHPLDSIKVLQQTKSGHVFGTTTTGAPSSSSSSSSSNNHSRSIMTVATNSNAFHSTPSSETKSRSIRSLYAGISGPLLTTGLIQSINFAMYDSIRRVLYRYDHPNNMNNSKNDYLYNDSIKNVAIASSISGCVLTMITSPLLVVKAKQQIMVWDLNKAIKDTLKLSPKQSKSSNSKVIQRLRNFYVGYGPHVIGASIGRGIYMSVYETLKRMFVRRKRDNNYMQHNVLSSAATTNYSYYSCTVPERMVCAAIAGVTSWSICFPLDVIQNRMYKQSMMTSLNDSSFSHQYYPRKQTKTRTSLSAWEMAKHMYNKNKSIRPFYRGYQVAVLRAGPVGAAVLPIYDITLEWLNKVEEK